jgi:hypothetical protein
MLTLRSAPPMASIFPSGEMSKLVTGFFETVLVLIKFHDCVSQTLMNAFLSAAAPLRFLPRALEEEPPPTVSGVEFTSVYRREDVVPRPKRAARKVHFKDCFRTGRSITWSGSGASVLMGISVFSEDDEGRL